MITKPWFKSLTIWSLIFGALGTILAAFAAGGWNGLFTDPAVGEAVGRVLQALGLVGAVVGRARALGPLTGHGVPSEDGRVALSVLFAALILLLFFALMSVAGGCSSNVCPDRQGIVATYRQRAPSFLSARCSGDRPDQERRRLEAPARGQFETLCPKGQLPGPKPGSITTVPCDHGTCTRSLLTCVPSGSAP